MTEAPHSYVVLGTGIRPVRRADLKTRVTRWGQEGRYYYVLRMQGGRLRSIARPRWIPLVQIATTEEAARRLFNEGRELQRQRNITMLEALDALRQPNP